MRPVGVGTLTGLVARYGREASRGRLQCSLALLMGLASLTNGFEAFVERGRPGAWTS
jgi:hypothetical protein